MKTIRLSERNWRPDDATLVHTGDYRVPQDMSEALAERALADGVAVLVEEAAPPAPAPMPPAAPEPATLPPPAAPNSPAETPSEHASAQEPAPAQRKGSSRPTPKSGRP